MKNHLLLVFLLSFFHLSAQQLIESELTNGMKLQLYDALELADGSILMTGLVNPPVGFDSAMSVLVKVDTALQLTWAKRLKGFRRDDFVSLTALSDDNLLVTGTMRGNFNNQSGGSVYKIDTAGNILWHKVYTDSFDDRVIAAFEQADSSLILIDRKGVSNTATKILHTTREGNLLSSRAYKTGNQGLVVDEAATNGNGIYYLVGDRFDGNLGYSQLVIQAVTDNAILWSQVYDLGASAFCTDIVCDSQGNLLLAGAIVDTTTVLSSNDAWLMKLNSQGSVIWGRVFAQEQSFTDFITDLVVLSDGGLLAAGTVFDGEKNLGLSLKVDSMGTPEWLRGYQQFSTQSLSTVISLADGRFFLLGSSPDGAFLLTTDSTGQSSCSDASLTLRDTLLNVSVSTQVYTNDPPSLTPNTPPVTLSDPGVSSALICSRSVAVEPSVVPFLVKLYPNPSRDCLYIDWPEEATETAQITLLDLQGRTCARLKVSPGQSGKIDLSDFPSGLYVAQVIAGERMAQHKILRE